MNHEIKLKMTFKKSTKNTHVYENLDESAQIPSLYIKRSAFVDGDKPKTITVVISDES